MTIMSVRSADPAPQSPFVYYEVAIRYENTGPTKPAIGYEPLDSLEWYGVDDAGAIYRPLGPAEELGSDAPDDVAVQPHDFGSSDVTEGVYRAYQFKVDRGANEFSVKSGGLTQQVL